jgi:hypothetical protein
MMNDKDCSGNPVATATALDRPEMKFPGYGAAPGEPGYGDREHVFSSIDGALLR